MRRRQTAAIEGSRLGTRTIVHALTCLLLTSIGLRPVGGQGAERPAREFSCASFPADLSETVLLERFGRANVRRAPVVGADDGPQDGTVVFDDSPMKIEMVWWDADARTRLAWVRTREPDSSWRTPTGITIGMGLLTIERRNGWPFRLAGLGAPEGRGIIQSWGRGRLRSSDPKGCRLQISLQPTGGPYDPVLYGHVLRGQDFSSGHPAMQAINPQVVELTIRHDDAREVGR